MPLGAASAAFERVVRRCSSVGVFGAASGRPTGVLPRQTKGATATTGGAATRSRARSGPPSRYTRSAERLFGAADHVLPGRTWAGISTADGEIPARSGTVEDPAQNDGSVADVVCRLSVTRDHRCATPTSLGRWLSPVAVRDEVLAW